MSDHDEILAEKSATNAQARADSAYRHALGVGAPARLSGEDPVSYRVRLAHGVQGFSPRWKDLSRSDLARLPAAGALRVAEEQIYHDAVESVKRNVGPLRKVTEVDPETGSRITKFYGNPQEWLDQFSNPTRHLVGINRNGGPR